MVASVSYDDASRNDGGDESDRSGPRGRRLSNGREQGEADIPARRATLKISNASVPPLRTLDDDHELSETEDRTKFRKEGADVTGTDVEIGDPPVHYSSGANSTGHLDVDTAKVDGFPSHQHPLTDKSKWMPSKTMRLRWCGFMICCVIVYILLATVASIYFFRRAQSVAPLEREVKRLTVGVENLEHEVGRRELEMNELYQRIQLLSVENEQFSTDNDNLELRIEECRELNAEVQLSTELQRLYNSSEECLDLNAKLQESKDECQNLNDLLAQQNEEYDRVNKELAADVLRLDEDLAEMARMDDNLTSTLQQKKELVDAVQQHVVTNKELRKDIEKLESQNDSLNRLTVGLRVAVDKLEVEHGQLTARHETLEQINEECRELNSQLQLSNEAFKNRHDTLRAKKEACNDMNKNLVGDAVQLKAEVLFLEEAKENLTVSLQLSDALNRELNFTVERCVSMNKALSEKVDDLAGEKSNLTRTLLELGLFVGELTLENDRFVAENERLAQNNDEYLRLNSQLHLSNGEFQRLNKWLQEENVAYKKLNSELAGNVQRMERQVDVLRKARTNLTSTVRQYSAMNKQLSYRVEQYEELNKDLSDEVDELAMQNDDLNQIVVGLENLAEDLAASNAEYKALNANLNTVVSFLDETSDKIDDTFDSLVAYLTGAIEENRRLLVRMTHATMEEKSVGWRCHLNDAFLEPWVDNTRLPIGTGWYENILDFIDHSLFGDLCIDMSDFALFLANRFDRLSIPSEISLRQLSSGVAIYVRNALFYYFPDDSATVTDGITDKEWSEARFRCRNLPVQRMYTWLSVR